MTLMQEEKQPSDLMNQAGDGGSVFRLKIKMLVIKTLVFIPDTFNSLTERHMKPSRCILNLNVYVTARKLYI